MRNVSEFLLVTVRFKDEEERMEKKNLKITSVKQCTHTHTPMPSAIPTHVVYEAFNLGLHAPVSELHFAELVGTHDGALTGILVDLLDPVV